jgi:hypothetical protein
MGASLYLDRRDLDFGKRHFTPCSPVDGLFRSIAGIFDAPSLMKCKRCDTEVVHKNNR